MMTNDAPSASARPPIRTSWFAACLALLGFGPAPAARAAPVLMISIDGLRPADVLDATARGLKVPNLTGLVREGAAASGVHDALPSVTYPNHTTLVTGVWPARHGVGSNLVFDPLGKDREGWFWYSRDIRTPTLWDAVHEKGRTVASLGWPVTVGARSIDANIPEYWRVHDGRDALLARALATPGLPEALEAAGAPLVDTGDTSPDGDAAKARDAAALYRLRRPAFFTLHLSSLDDVQHAFGPGTPEARAALERIDGEVGEILAAARQVEPDLVVAVVSDHGFAPVSKEVNLGVAFVQAGLIRLGPDGTATSWEAAPWVSGGSAGVVLARPDDPALQARVDAVLARLAADPESGVLRVADRSAVARAGGDGRDYAFVDAKAGYMFGGRLVGPLVTASEEKGVHGYFPDRPEMHATLILQGPGVPVGRNLGEVDMRRIAPTLAHILGVPLPGADLGPLF
jgi:predicted AlkP superfamily pyrophosphatase or phosphodiesterase